MSVVIPVAACRASRRSNCSTLSIESLIASRMGIVNVLDYGATGVSDDTAAVQMAANAAEGKILLIPSGRTFIIGNISLPNNVIVTGGGTLKFSNNTTASGLIAAEGKTNITISNVNFDGNISNQSTWSQHRHCIIVKDSSHVVISGCRFTNPIGDCIYLGRIDSASAPYVGATNVVITNCDCIGSSQNRNGVSIVCGESIEVSDNLFSRMARSTMPGGVDLEPDGVNEFVRNVLVSGNIFIGHELADLGSQTGVSLNNTQNGSISGVSVDGNIFDGNFQYCTYLIGGSGGNDSALVTGNIIRNHQYTAPDVARAISTKGFNVSITSNIIDTFMGVGMWLETGTIECVSNFVRRAQKQGIVVGPAALVARNTIIDAGYNGANSQRCGIYMESTGATISGNQIISSGPTVTLYGILSSVGSGNAISENFLTGIGTANFSSVGSQIWGINYTATSPGPDILAANDRKILLWRGADPFADNMQIQFGGTTASYAAILAVGQAIRAVLADGSGYAKFYANTLFLNSLPTYANNAAALGGGLVAGDIYQVTGTDPRQMAKVF